MGPLLRIIRGLLLELPREAPRETITSSLAVNSASIPVRSPARIPTVFAIRSSARNPTVPYTRAI